MMYEGYCGQNFCDWHNWSWRLLTD